METLDSDSQQLLERARQGDAQAINEVFLSHRARLRRMVELRLDNRLRSRLDPSDVVQEAFVEVADRLPEYLEQPHMPLYLWLRLVVGQHLIDLHRHHLGAEKRNAAREVPLYTQLPEASSVMLAAQLSSSHTTPSQAAARAEMQERVQRAIESLEPLDREILALRHSEQLDRHEAARVLGISEEAAAKRYLRALGRLRECLGDVEGALS